MPNKLYTISEVFRHCVREGKLKSAFLYVENKEVKSISYEQFERDVINTVAYMSNSGLTGKHLALLGDFGYKWVVMSVAIMCLGAVLVPLDREFQEENIEKMDRMADIDVYFYDENHRQVMFNCIFDKEKKLINMDECYEICTKLDIDVVDMCDDPNSICLFLGTSGTTGKQKVAMLSQKALGFLAIENRTEFELHEEERIFMGASLAHAYGIMKLVMTLYEAKTICLNVELKFLMRDYNMLKPTVVYTVPMIVDSIISYMKKNNFETDTHCLVYAGAALKDVDAKSKELKKHGISLLNVYGMTELCIMFAEREKTKKYNSLGEPYIGVKFKLLDDELFIKSPTMFSGYYKNEEETSKVFIDGWFRTGDLVEQDVNGCFILKGRSKNLIIRDDGNNVSPEYLEDRIYSSIPYVTEALVYLEKGLIAAEVYCEDGDKLLNLESDFEYLNEKLLEFEKIEKIIVRDKPFEKTISNKIKRISIC